LFQNETTLIVYKGSLDIFVLTYDTTEEIPDYLTEGTYDEEHEKLFNSLFNKTLEEQSERYYLENKGKFEERLYEEFAPDLDDELLLELKEEFFKKNNPSLVDEIWDWVTNAVETQLSGLAEQFFEVSEYTVQDPFVSPGQFLVPREKIFTVGFVEIWDLESGKRKDVKWGPRYSGTGFTALPNIGFAIGSFDGNIEIWDQDLSNTLLMLKGHTDFIRTQSLHPERKLLATGSDDATIRIWDFNKNSSTLSECLHTLKIKMNCRDLKLDGTLGLNAKAPTENLSLGEWLVQRGALLTRGY
jgi:hypothetical protein